MTVGEVKYVVVRGSLKRRKLENGALCLFPVFPHPIQLTNVRTLSSSGESWRLYLYK